MACRKTLNLVRAYYQIAVPEVRKRILRLARSLGVKPEAWDFDLIKALSVDLNFTELYDFGFCNDLRPFRFKGLVPRVVFKTMKCVLIGKF